MIPQVAPPTPSALVVAHKSAPPVTMMVAPLSAPHPEQNSTGRDGKDPYKKFEALIAQHYPDPTTAPRILEPEPGLYRCSFCSSSKSGCKFNIWTHIKSIHLKLKDFQCAFCSFQASRKYSLDTHFRKAHLKLNGNFIPCPSCEFKSTSLNLFITHTEKIHGLANLVRLETSREDPTVRRQLEDIIQFRTSSGHRNKDSFLVDYMRKLLGSPSPEGGGPLPKRQRLMKEPLAPPHPRRKSSVKAAKIKPTGSSDEESDPLDGDNDDELDPRQGTRCYICPRCQRAFISSTLLAGHLVGAHGFEQHAAQRVGLQPENRQLRRPLDESGSLRRSPRKAILTREPRLILEDINKPRRVPHSTARRRPGPKSRTQVPSALQGPSGPPPMVAKKSIPLPADVSVPFVAKKSVPCHPPDDPPASHAPEESWLDEAIHNTMDMSLEHLNALADTFEDDSGNNNLLEDSEHGVFKENIPKQPKVKWHRKTHYECYYCDYRSLKMNEFTLHFNETHRSQVLADTAPFRKPPKGAAEVATSYVVNFENM
ncbi:hypothetical protein TCAL_14467 [Tigriopus californicus]|uniref:C2H2-type domain-containing protein n=1 Tax=Tigriopus californicus TaxID=6832 RepID=A0A553PSH7_TIGCA|nr:hypothetical protein TCAL_14467 [Tigriopus californicus]